MAMLNFLANALVLLCSPISLIAGALLAFLFHKEMWKLGWGLLFLVVPSIGSLSASGSHGALYDSVARFIAVSCLTAIFYQLLELRLYGKPRPGQLP